LAQSPATRHCTQRPSAQIGVAPPQVGVHVASQVVWQTCTPEVVAVHAPPSGQVPFSHLINAVFGTEVHDFGWTVPAIAAILLTMVVMVALAWVVNQLIFRHLVGQEPIILFMATIGLAYFLEGTADLMWGSEIRTLNVGLPQGINTLIDETTYQWFGYGFFIDNLDIVASVVAAVLVAVLVAFAQYTKQGRAMRAVADDHQAALSVGVSLNFVWILVWSLAGIVALVAGGMWGSK